MHEKNATTGLFEITPFILDVKNWNVANGTPVQLVNTYKKGYECENGDFTEEECRQIQEMDGLVQGVGTAFLFVCNGFCGLLIAIPLMLNNGGLDNSSLFKSSKN